MTALVLVTRPIEQAKDFAAEIETMGAVPVIQPLLDIEYYPFDFNLVTKPDAVILTSVQSMEGREFPDEWQRDVPIFCVGSKSEDSARAAGAHILYSGQSGIKGLIPVIRDKIEPGKNILYLCGEHVTQDLQEALPEYVVESRVLYRARPVLAFRDDVMCIFPKVKIITLFSRRSAEILYDIMIKNGLISVAGNIKLLCLSPAVLESVHDGRWKSCHVADSPNVSAMLEKLKDIIQE